MNRALASALLVAVMIAGCGEDDDDDASTTPSTHASTSTSNAEHASSTTTTTELADVDADDVRSVVRDWLAAIAQGDDDTAISLTAPRSMEAIGGTQGFVESEIALAEGWGSWHDADDLEIDVAETADAREAVIAVLHGEVALEAPPEERWTAMPVIATSDGVLVEPFLDLGHVEADPPGDTVIDADAELSVYALGNRDVGLWLDGRPGQQTVEGADGDQQRVTLTRQGPLDPGVHGLVVVVANDDGVMARTFNYTVE